MNSQLSKSLNTTILPLHGIHLIEASAGTGKTYTITNIYLRIILGHGDANSKHVSPLTVDQILVVTFTEAATEELRDRIRTRIHDARLAFIKTHSDDPFISMLLKDLTNHHYCIALLLAAERQMDEATIFTIHGFCQRMLKQHAFESGTLFSSELVKDTSTLLQTSAEDFWRKYFYPLNKPLSQLVSQLWKTPIDLMNSIKRWIDIPDLIISSQQVPNSIEEFKQEYVKSAIAIKDLWQKDREDIEDQLKTCGLKKNSKPYKRIAKIRDFLLSNELEPPLKDPSGWKCFSKEIMHSSLNKTGSLPKHNIFTKIDSFTNKPLNLKTAFEAIVIRDAIKIIKSKFNLLKEQHHQRSFSDLLVHMDRALIDNSNTETGNQLAAAIRQQFRITMIDEFQDTDPLQYRIFSRIYIDDENKDNGLFIIGDPKQAIYAFRGADIFTYIKAKTQIRNRYSLNTNWRSSVSMVTAVNTLFNNSENPFIYKESIPFDPVEAIKGPSDIQLYDHNLSIHNQTNTTSPSLIFWLQEKTEFQTVNKESYLSTMSEATATEINRLLTDAQQQKCTIYKDQQNSPLTPEDIAILVRTGNQAKKIQEALAKQNIPSIYLSEKNSVYLCQEAKDLERILTACLNPTHEHAVRAALASPLLELDAASLDAINHDEKIWENAVEEFSDYQSIWLESGITPMLRRLIQRRNIATMLLSSSNGERRLTDIMHLIDLLNSVSNEHDSPNSLLHWYSQQLITPNNEAEEQQLHLESEQNLIKIITIHKSKGLEYNITFIPFPCHFRKSDTPLYHDPHSCSSILDLTRSKRSKELAEQERLAEDIRLLYVALTRSVYRCYLGIAPLKSGRSAPKGESDLHYTAIGYLLNQHQPMNAEILKKRLISLTNSCPDIALFSPPIATFAPYTLIESSKPELIARDFTTNIERNWRMTSYSGIAKTARSARTNHVQNQTSQDHEQQLEEYQKKQSSQSTDCIKKSYTLFDFPKGAQPGTFIHNLFERVNFEKALSGGLTDFVQQQLILEGYDEQWTDAITNMLMDCLLSPLDGQSMRLHAIPLVSRKIEMEFHLPISQMHANELNDWISHHDSLSAQSGIFDFQQFQGMLKGFIDLTFEYHGQWYVLDYKSNWLGSTIEEYSREQIEQVMIEHRYDLQYQIYSLAIHRMLKLRLPDYDFNRHFGGIIYLFIRGVRADSETPYGIYNHKPSKLLIEGLDHLFSGNNPNRLLSGN